MPHDNPLSSTEIHKKALAILDNPVYHLATDLTEDETKMIIARAHEENNRRVSGLPSLPMPTEIGGRKSRRRRRKNKRRSRKFK